MTLLRATRYQSPLGLRGVLLAALGLIAAGCGAGERPTRRVIVLGFDGLDHGVTSRLMAEGKLRNLARLAEAGGFSPLETSIPPQSPVAWSDFITGLDAGNHGIFDFIHRKPETMEPYLSTSQTEEAGLTLRLGGWRVPVTGGGVTLLRHGTPFWEVLEANGIPTTIVRIPANFPPSGKAGRELGGMGTPDVLGTYGTFSFFTTAPERYRKDPSGGEIHAVRVVEGAVRDSLLGPANPFRADERPLAVPFVAHLDAVRPVALLTINDEAIILNEGEWSDWVRVEFPMLPAVTGLEGIVRFYLKEVHPRFELYVTPINLDPLGPAMPISAPADFAADLARATGLYYTQGMPEDTKALTSGVLDEDEFLRQAHLAAEEHVRQYYHLLPRFEGGLLFYYFGFVDQVSHVMWHAADPTHPAHDPERDGAYSGVVDSVYVRVDEIIGETMNHLTEDATLIVMSDHGFASWRRAFNLNSWLKENGYLAVRDSEPGDLPFLQSVDWTRTQAYGLGLSGLYLNLRGRERFGTVGQNRLRPLRDEIARRLLEVVDPATGRRAITKVYVRDDTYADGGHRDLGPDLIIGYARGVRASEATAEGRIPPTVFEDNTGKWSGDHIMDHEVVPGVLFSNRPLHPRPRSLRELGGTLLAEFGVLPTEPTAPGRQEADGPPDERRPGQQEPIP